jgi:hypothetical protein
MGTQPGGASPDQPPPQGAEIIDLKAARRRDTARRLALQGILPETRDQVRHRMVQNLWASLIVITLVGGGAWLIANLRESLRLEHCFETGRRTCLKIDTEKLPK